MAMWINKGEAANRLQISPESLKNWIQKGYIKEQNKKILLSDLSSLEFELNNGRFSHLKSRANKYYSQKTFLPKESFESSQAVKQVENLLLLLEENHFIPMKALFFLALGISIKRDEISKEEALDLNFKNIKRASLRSLFREWSQFFSFSKEEVSDYSTLFNFSDTECQNFLGLVYQSILKEGEKAKKGSYYTPNKILSFLYSDMDFKDKKILDPCCGTGDYLLFFSKKIENPLSLYGIDSDPIAVFITKFNLLEYWKYLDFNPSIFCLDTLKLEETSQGENPFFNQFDLVVTNPPWGAHFNQRDRIFLKKKYPEIKTSESFSYFLWQGLKFLKKKGQLSYLLPESLCYVRSHADIRSELLKQGKIQEIIGLGPCFTHVMSSVFLLNYQKGEYGEDEDIQIRLREKQYSIVPNRFKLNHHLTFDFYTTNKDYSYIKKIESRPCVYLKKQAKWALGIITGDNKRFLRESPLTGYEPIYRGRDIYCGYLKGPSSFINFHKNSFQQVASEELYRHKDKLIYRFISDHLVFYHDTQGVLTLNSANIVIPSIPNYPNWLISLFLNSNFASFYFNKKYNSCKVLKNHLENFPLPIFNSVEINNILKNKNIADRIKEIDKIFY